MLYPCPVSLNTFVGNISVNQRKKGDKELPWKKPLSIFTTLALKFAFRSRDLTLDFSF